jgi:hypothetical protein
MTTSQPTGNPTPDWDTSVLDLPVVLDVPDRVTPDLADPLLAAALEALLATAAGMPGRPYPIGNLGRAGVVAIRTSAGAFEIRETLLGWVLVIACGDPDPYDLAGAARLRAHRLALARRHGVP